MRKLEGIVRLTLGLTWVLGTSAVLVLILLFLLPFRGARVRVCNVYGKIVSPPILWVVRANLTWHRRELIEQNKPAIYISNHTSMTDIFLGMLLLPVGGVGIAKKEIAKIPLYGWAYRLSGHLLIDRSNRETAIAGMKETAALVKKFGMSIWVWPEGTRSKDGRMLPFKKGFAHLALATGLPIVPVVVTNAHKNWAKHTMTAFRRTAIDVIVLDPIDTSGWTEERLGEHIAEVEQIMAAALPDEQKPPPRLEDGAA